MTPQVRPIREDELPAFFEALTTAFLDRRDVDKLAAEVKPWWDLRRAFAAFDGQTLCGTFRSWPSELTVPGGAQVPATAVTAVTVLPTHRRRGMLRAMAAAEHAAARDRGEALGLLYASEYPIYGRFGYGPASRVATWTLNAGATGFHQAPAGSIELIKPGPEAVQHLKAVYEAWRVRQVGEMKRRDYGWDYDLGLRPTSWGPDWKGYLAVHRNDADAVDGYVRYRSEEKWEKRQPLYLLKVDELHALNDDAYRSLWRFLAEVDMVATVRAESRSPAERLPWLLTNGRAASASDVGEGLWVRLLDVPLALASRTYEREGTLVLDVVDREAPDGRSRLLLDGTPTGATCTPTERSPDLTLDVAALGAAYLGGTRLRDAVLASGADEHTPGALARADALFRTADEPWCSTSF